MMPMDLDREPILAGDSQLCFSLKRVGSEVSGGQGSSYFSESLVVTRLDVLCLEL